MVFLIFVADIVSMDYYRISQAAALLKVSASSMWRYVEQGRVEYSRNPSGQRVFTLEALENFNGGPLFSENNRKLTPQQYSMSEQATETKQG